MTEPTAVGDRAGAAGRGSRPVLPGNRKRAVASLLADPRLRLAVGAAGLAFTAMAVRRNRVSRCEAEAFRAINGLQDSWYLPAWVIMQLGTLGAAPAAAGTAWLAGNRELAGRLMAGGSATWALSKVVKRVVRRPRPADLLAGTQCRGRGAAGLGYLSGHAGVAAALGAAALPDLGPVGRTLTLAAVPVVGLTRLYVGAHLPLDVVGGVALGLAVDAVVTLIDDGRRQMAPDLAICDSASAPRSHSRRLMGQGIHRS